MAALAHTNSNETACLVESGVVDRNFKSRYGAGEPEFLFPFDPSQLSNNEHTVGEKMRG